MPSSVYYVSHMNWDKSKKTRGRKKIEISDQTIRNYKHYAVVFLDWCNEHYGTNSPRACRKHIQDYADYLEATGKSANTIHDYINGICRVFEVSLLDINRPKRVTAANKNNRRAAGPKPVDFRSDAKAERSPRLYAFATLVGIRRHEYLGLHQNDFDYDESGWPCVIVRKGKNGKEQYQRVPLDCVEEIQKYFGGSENYVFSYDELNNKINLHRLRGDCARRWYSEYAHRIETEPGYAIALREQLHRRFARCEVLSKWSSHEVEGFYRIRGENRKLAEALGLSTDYYRLAVMAVSVFHLSHWRNNVAVSNYLLAV